MYGNFNDEHAGKGGSYVKEADGIRVLQERTDHPSTGSGQAHESPSPAPVDTALTTTKPKAKGVNNA